MHVMAVGARAILIAILVVMLAGCTPKKTAMPALVVPGVDDWPTVHVALCGDERIRFANLSKGEGKIKHGEEASEVFSDRVVVFDLSLMSLEEGSLSDEVPVTQFIPFPTAPSDPSSLGRFAVYTTGHRVAIEFSSVWQDPPSPVLVYGVQGTDAEAYVKVVTLEEGEKTLDGWCTSIE